MCAAAAEFLEAAIPMVDTMWTAHEERKGCLAGDLPITI
jgi:hypothetical protein